MSGIAHKELLFVLCSTDWRLWYLVVSEFAFVSGFFILTKWISTEACLATLPNTFVGRWFPLIVRLKPGHENRTMRTGMPKQDTKTSLCVTPDIPDIVCVSHESQCLGFDTECSDRHSSFSFTVRVPQAHRDANTHAVSSFLLLSVWPVSVDAFQMNEFRFGVLCWSASSGVIKSHPVYCTLPPVKSC